MPFQRRRAPIAKEKVLWTAEPPCLNAAHFLKRINARRLRDKASPQGIPRAVDRSCARHVSGLSERKSDHAEKPYGTKPTNGRSVFDQTTRELVTII